MDRVQMIKDVINAGITDPSQGISELNRQLQEKGLTDPGFNADEFNNLLQTRSQWTQAAPVVSAQTQPFSLPSDLVYGTSLLKSNFTDSDLASALREQSQLRQQLVTSMQPTQRENELQRQLTTLRDTARTYKTNVQEGMNREEERAIPMEFITGRQASMERRANLQLQRYQDEEANLLSSLGLEQEARKQQANAYSTGLSMLQSDINLQMLVKQRQQEQENAIFTRAMQLQEGARKSLADILDNFKGMRFADLDQATQTQLQQLAQRSGIPGGLMEAGLEAVYNSSLIEQLSKAASNKPASYREWELAGGLEGTGQTYAQYIAKTSGLDSKTATIVESLARSFDTHPLVKQFNEVLNKKISVDSIIENGLGGPSDLALVYEFMKALDPTSVVRESEYATASKSGNIFLGAWARFNGYFKEEGGMLPDNVKSEFQSIVAQKFNAAQKQYRNYYDETVRKINSKTGLTDGADYLTQYDFTQPTTTNLPQIRQSFNTLQDLLNTYPEYSAFVEDRLNYTDDPNEILNEIYQLNEPDFNTDLSKSENGSSEIKKIASAIGQFESGGDYKAQGPTVTSGMYKGDRAYGKYQIMGKNIPQWSKEALGRSISLQEFLNNPELQDRIAEYKMGKIYEKYGTVEDTASVWFTGNPVATAGNVKDVLGTTAPQYIKNVRSIYNSIG